MILVVVVRLTLRSRREVALIEVSVSGRYRGDHGHRRFVRLVRYQVGKQSGANEKQAE